MWSIKLIKYRPTENKLIVTRYVQKCPPLARTQARKRAGHWSTASSISKCSKLCHTHSRPVAAHQCHELCFVRMLLNACRRHSFLFPEMQKILKSIKIFQSHDHKCAATFLHILRVHFECEMWLFHHKVVQVHDLGEVDIFFTCVCKTFLPFCSSAKSI